jgi:hypothetical protein
MIDVLHPNDAAIDHSIDHSNEHLTEENRDDNASGPDAEEAAWLESIQSASVAQVKMPEKGTFVMDVGQLREGA